MLFTGSELIQKRNFYSQYLDYGFVVSTMVDNTTGTYHFGLSGNGGVLDFVLESGRMYYDNKFIHSYKANEEFTVEAQFSTGRVNVLKNDSPLAYGLSKQTGVFDYFYFTRQTAQMGAEFDLQVSGNNAPAYTLSNQGYLYSSGQNAVTGWLVNQGSFPIRVFDSEEQSSVIYDFGKLAGNIATNGGSGAFAFTGDYNTLDFSQPIITTFSTNYGNIGVDFSIIDARSLNWFIQFTGPTDFGFNSSNVLSRDLSYLNFSGGVATDAYNPNLTFVLGYISGSGVFSGYDKSFTGSWSLSTGLTSTTLVPISPSSNILYSGSGIFPPNSSINFQVTYAPSGETPDGAYLFITGLGVINGINQQLTMPL